jgi:hypothetical protein
MIRETVKLQVNKADTTPPQDEGNEINVRLPGELADPSATAEMLQLETSSNAMEQIEDFLFEWECWPNKATPEEQNLVHIEALDELLRLAESTRFSGAVVMAFGHGYLWIMEARTAAQTLSGESRTTCT